jgi:hypothetical protein
LLKRHGIDLDIDLDLEAALLDDVPSDTVDANH